MEYIKVYADEDLRRSLKLAATQKGISEAEMARRLLNRGLGLETAHSSITVIQEALRGLLREELAPVRRLALIGAFEAAAANSATIEALGGVLVRMPGAPGRDLVLEVVRRVEARSRSVAVQRTRDPNPERAAEPDPEGLPQADEVIELSPPDADLFKDKEARNG